MLGQHRQTWVVRLLAADGAVLVLAFGAAYLVRAGLDPWAPRAAGPLAHYLWLVPPLVLLWVALLALRGGYGVRWLAGPRATGWLVLEVSALGALVIAGALFFLSVREVNRSLLILYAVLGALGLWAGRWLVRRRLRRGGQQLRHTLVVGTDARAARVIAALARYPEARWAVTGCLGLTPDTLGGAVAGVTVSGLLGDLPEILQAPGVVDEVVFAVPAERRAELAEALAVCEDLGVDARVLLDVYEPARARPFIEELFGLPVYGFSPTLTRQGALLAKRGVDVLASLGGLVLLAPLLLLIGLAVRLSSPGPALFSQERVGFRGRRFRMHKFRTMVIGAEAMRDEVAHLNLAGGPAFKAAADPRVTRFGRLLRRTSLDELPQLWNVLRGEMSLVGPRPLPRYEADLLRGHERRRLAMRPGLTGLWQVSGRSMVRFEEWIQLDLAYVDRWSIGLDLQILLRTVPAVIRGEGAL